MPNGKHGGGVPCIQSPSKLFHTTSPMGGGPELEFQTDRHASSPYPPHTCLILMSLFISTNKPPSHIESQRHIFLSRPYCGALLFENSTSDARDHCANERTFLSWLRLSMYLA